MTKEYCITKTPGLVTEGSYPLSAPGLLRGEMESASQVADFGAPMAVFKTREIAAAWVERIVPAGKDPASYAGLEVVAADRYPTFVSHGMTIKLKDPDRCILAAPAST